ncbi:ankyrin repeat-containing domain protein [Baffinella frigidus]|nr:ankyrin repeat-containing domain protein [Cryptophyta sp. CCMP2293]
MDTGVFGQTIGGWLSVMFPAPELSTASGLGDTKKIRRLLAGGADIEERGGILRTSPLQWAARNGQAAAVLVLLEHGADVSAKDKTGWTALHWAGYQGREEISLLLLQHGADPSAKDYVLGETPVDLAASQYHHQLVAMLKAEAVSRAKCVA